MAGIFLSYRRSDSADVAGRIYDRLVQDFSREMVFKDNDSIPLSVPFPSFLRSELQRADVLLVLIGPSWLECKNAEGNRRLDDADDYVRIEIETAIDLGVPMVPIALSGTKMPRPFELPESLQSLTMKNGQEIRPDPDFHRDMDRLARRLRPLVHATPSINRQCLNRSSLREILTSAQDWYNEIIRTAAQLRTVSSHDDLDPVQFVYVNTRSFLPKLLSLRKLMPLSGPTAELAAMIDEFVDLLTYTDNDQPIIYCRPLAFRREDSQPGMLVTDSRGLSELSFALQRVSDAVMGLLASYGEDSQRA